MRTRDTSIYPISFCHIGIILFLMSLFSCSVPDRLEIALQFAGDNRPELEKVLVHYKDDSLKLHAARACGTVGRRSGPCSAVRRCGTRTRCMPCAALQACSSSESSARRGCRSVCGSGWSRTPSQPRSDRC